MSVKTSADCWMKNCCKGVQVQHCDTEDSYCPKLFKLDALYNNSLLGVAQRNQVMIRLDADGTDREAFSYLKSIERNIEQFVNSGKNLYICSRNTGNGKTLWATRFIQEYFNAIWHKSDVGCKALFVHVPKLLLELKENISNKSAYVEHIKENILNAPLVVWDEVGTKSATQFEHEHLLNFINTRVNNGLSNIYTSNLMPEELCEKLGDRLYSRVVNLSTVVTLYGKDKRNLMFK